MLKHIQATLNIDISQPSSIFYENLKDL